jgi:hypothetical protein
MSNIAAIVEEFNKSEPFKAKLPVTLKNGFTLTMMSGRCAECKAPLDDNLMRGSIVLFPEQERPNVVCANGYGYCEDCEVLTEYVGRVRAGGKDTYLEVFRAKGWVRFRLVHEKRWKRLRKKILDFLQG